MSTSAFSLPAAYVTGGRCACVWVEGLSIGNCEEVSTCCGYNSRSQHACCHFLTADARGIRRELPPHLWPSRVAINGISAKLQPNSLHAHPVVTAMVEVMRQAVPCSVSQEGCFDMFQHCKVAGSP